MANQPINTGTSPSHGDGDPLRIAFTKINDNFAELYASDAYSSVQSVNGLTGDITLGVADIIGAASIDLVISKLNIITTVPLTSKGSVGDVAGMLSYNSVYFYYCVVDYTDGTADIWRRIANDTLTW